MEENEKVRLPASVVQELLLNDKEKSLRDKDKAGLISLVPATVFLREPKRKPREPWHVYKRSMKNYKKALKIRLRYGPDAHLYLDKSTLTII